MVETTEVAPWGWWRLVDDEPITKIICVNPGGMLSLQSHANRTETWIPERTGLIMYRIKWNKTWQDYGSEPEVVTMKQNNTYFIDKNDKHRLINPTDQPLKLIEIIGGAYSEDDITRYQDIYDRS